MSVKSNKNLGSLGSGRFNFKENEEQMNNEVDDDDEDEPMDAGDEDSMIELGQIAILGSSKISLRYKSSHDIHSSRTSGLNKPQDVSSRFLLNKSALSIKEDKLTKEAHLEPEIQEPVPIVHKLLRPFLPYRGYFFGIMSAFVFCLSQVSMKRAKTLTASDHSTIRYFTTFVIMITYLKYRNMRILGPRKQLKLILFRGFIGSCALITIYFALQFIKPSDVTTLAHSSIIITAILARIFLKEKLTLAHFVAILFTASGVIFISKPSVLFGSNDPKLLNLNATNCSNCSQSSETSDENLKMIFGITLTFIGALASSCVFLVLKKLCNSKVHWACSTICVCWFGFPFSVVISGLLIHFDYAHQDFESEKPFLPMDLFYSVFASCLSLSGQIFLNVSLKVINYM